MIDIKPQELTIIKQILTQYVPGTEARVFGSRVQGRAKKFSDIDIALVGEEKLPPLTMALLRQAFEESDLPFRVDILDWLSISAEFKKVIEARYEVLS